MESLPLLPLPESSKPLDSSASPEVPPPPPESREPQPFSPERLRPRAEFAFILQAVAAAPGGREWQNPQPVPAAAEFPAARATRPSGIRNPFES
jgi:hypothetical protein